MHLCELVRTSAAVAEVSSRLEKIDRLASLLGRLPPDEIAIGAAFLSGATRQGRIGVGWSLIAAARAVAPSAEPSIELREVDDLFARIAASRGPGSSQDKARLLRDLLGRATSEEQDFLTRLLFGELRQGAVEGVLVEAVAKASGIPAGVVRRAAMMAGDIGPVAHAALVEGEAGLTRFAVQLFRPVQPMLADSAESLEEALERIGDAALEFKLDGARIQIHKSQDEVKVFSRSLREVTPAVPEVIDAVRALPAREAILDGEVIALKPDGSPWPFQITMRRFGRRLDVDRLRGELPLTPFFFDLLYLDGRTLLDEPQSRRFGALRDLSPADLVIPHTSGASRDEAARFLQESIARGHEGVMAKAIDAAYAAGKRGQAWMKVKVARTLDLVVLAAEWGHGRRRGWLSNLHLGARDPERGAFVMLGKTFKGLTDEMLVWQTKRLLELELARDDYTVHVRPELVVEIAFNEIQASRQYPGGLALRFARVKRYREDKRVEDADTIATVQQMFRQMTNS